MVNYDGNEHAKKAQQLPASTQFAIVTTLPNIVNGAFWGFTSVEDAKKHKDAFLQDKNITARKLGNACLIEVNPDYLIKVVSLVDSNLVRKEDIDTMRRCMTEAYSSFEKFLVNKGEKGFAGLVGIYCVNDSNAISYKGNSYPAFRLPIEKVIELCNKWGYMISVGGSYVSPKKALSSGQELFNSMTLSPTNTGVFLNIKSTLSSEQIKLMKKQMFPKK